MKNEKYALLKKDSPLFKIFPDGRIPMKHFSEETGEGGQKEKIGLYGLDLTLLGKEDIKHLLSLLNEMGIMAGLRNLEKEGYKILEDHIIGVSSSDFRSF